MACVMRVIYPSAHGKEIEQFFLTPVPFEHKGVRLQGWDGRGSASKVIEQAVRAYQQTRDKVE
jgi:inorganic pyrophosphatase